MRPFAVKTLSEFPLRWSSCTGNGHNQARLAFAALVITLTIHLSCDVIDVHTPQRLAAGSIHQLFRPAWEGMFIANYSLHWNAVGDQHVKEAWKMLLQKLGVGRKPSLKMEGKVLFLRPSLHLSCFTKESNES